MAGVTPRGASRCRGGPPGCWGLSAGDAGSTFWLPRPHGGWTRRSTEQPLDHMDICERQPGPGDAKRIAGMPPPPPALGGCRGAASAIPCPTPSPLIPKPTGEVSEHPAPHRGTRMDASDCSRSWGTRRLLQARPIPRRAQPQPQAAATSPSRLFSQGLCLPHCSGLILGASPKAHPAPSSSSPIISHKQLGANSRLHVKAGTEHLWDSQELNDAQVGLACLGTLRAGCWVPGIARGSLQRAGPAAAAAGAQS